MTITQHVDCLLPGQDLTFPILSLGRAPNLASTESHVNGSGRRTETGNALMVPHLPNFQAPTGRRLMHEPTLETHIPLSCSLFPYGSGMLFILGFTFLLNLDSLMIFYCLILTKLAPSCLIPTPVPNSGSPGPLRRSAYLFSQFSSVTQVSLTLCDPMDCSTQDLPGHHQLPEPTQTHVL